MNWLDRPFKKKEEVLKELIRISVKEQYETSFDKEKNIVRTVCNITFPNGEYEGAFGISRVEGKENYKQTVSNKIAFANAMRFFAIKNFKIELIDNSGL